MEFDLIHDGSWPHSVRNHNVILNPLLFESSFTFTCPQFNNHFPNIFYDNNIILLFFLLTNQFALKSISLRIYFSLLWSQSHLEFISLYFPSVKSTRKISDPSLLASVQSPGESQNAESRPKGAGSPYTDVSIITFFLNPYLRPSLSVYVQIYLYVNLPLS